MRVWLLMMIMLGARAYRMGKGGMTRGVMVRRGTMAMAAAMKRVAEVLQTNEGDVGDDLVAVKGWVRTVRKQKNIAFLEVNDGSSLKGIQAVVKMDEETTKQEVEKVTHGNGRL